MVQQDRAVPGALADAVQYAVSLGLLQPTLGLPVLEVAGNSTDRAELGGTSGVRAMLPAGCAAFELVFFCALICWNSSRCTWWR